MPPKKRNTESKGNSQTKRRKKQKDDIEEFDDDSGAELDNANNGTETDETYDVVSFHMDLKYYYFQSLVNDSQTTS